MSARIAIEVEQADRLELPGPPADVLAFGSRLLHGSVGLNASERAYRAHDFTVIGVPTIVLSVMPHYTSTHHLDVSPRYITEALHDLTSAGALSHLRLVTSGYLASPEHAAPIAAWYEGLAPTNRLPFVLDPTLGDSELGFYTDPAVADAVRSELLPLATGLTPNVFELAAMTGTPLDSLGTNAKIEAAARSLMTPHTEWIAITGITSTDEGSSSHSLTEMLVTPSETHLHQHPALPSQAKGAGDLFTAAFSSALLHDRPLHAAVSDAAQYVRSVLAGVD